MIPMNRAGASSGNRKEGRAGLIMNEKSTKRDASNWTPMNEYCISLILSDTSSLFKMTMTSRPIAVRFNTITYTAYGSK
jgi:hypothetical protein